MRRFTSSLALSTLLATLALAACANTEGLSDADLGAGGAPGAGAGGEGGEPGEGEGGENGEGGQPGDGGEGGEAGYPAECTAENSRRGGDPDNCGVCGHTCLGGTCVKGACQPIKIRSDFPKSTQVVVDESLIYYVHPTSRYIARGPKDTLEVDEKLVDDETLKQDLAIPNDVILWRSSPQVVKQLPKGAEAEVEPTTALEIDFFGPEISIDPTGLYFTTQSGAFVAAPGGSA
ncbi:MAG: hypothetical protein EOO75_16800, partial [Myxococcales bacterium]